MSATNPEAVQWDPYNPQYFRDPYPVFRRLREEAPLYHNAEHGFYALSRYVEVERALKDTQSLTPSRTDSACAWNPYKTRSIKRAVSRRESSGSPRHTKHCRGSGVTRAR
jgi:cytochrome P450